MKKTILTLVAFIAILTVNAQKTWKLDKGHSSITFSVSHLLISEVTGNFGEFDVTATANEKFENPFFNATIDVSTINTNNERRDNHLKAPDFFDAKGHEQITFKSTTYEYKKNGEINVIGDITIKGITKRITFNGKLNGIVEDPYSKKSKAGLKFSTTINRSDFEIGSGMSSIGKDVTITVNVEMILE